MSIAYAYENYYYRHLRAAIEWQIDRIAHSVGGSKKAKKLQQALIAIDRDLQEGMNKYHYYRVAFKKTLLPLFKERRRFKKRPKAAKSFTLLTTLIAQIDRAMFQDILHHHHAVALAPNQQFFVESAPEGYVVANGVVNKRLSRQTRDNPTVSAFRSVMMPYGQVTDHTIRTFAQALVPGLLAGTPYLFNDQLHLRSVQGMVEFACLDNVNLKKRLLDFDDSLAEFPEKIAPFTGFFKGAEHYPFELFYSEVFTTELLRLIDQAQQNSEAQFDNALFELRPLLTKKQAAILNSAEYKNKHLNNQSLRLEVLRNCALELTLWRIYKNNSDDNERQVQLKALFAANPQFSLDWVTMRDGTKEPTSHTLRTLLARENVSPEQSAGIVDSWVQAAQDWPIQVQLEKQRQVLVIKQLSFCNFKFV